MEQRRSRWSFRREESSHDAVCRWLGPGGGRWHERAGARRARGLPGHRGLHRLHQLSASGLPQQRAALNTHAQRGRALPHGHRARGKRRGRGHGVLGRPRCLWHGVAVPRACRRPPSTRHRGHTRRNGCHLWGSPARRAPHPRLRRHLAFRPAHALGDHRAASFVRG